MKALTEKLADIQARLNAPKGQFNSFGNYHYRSCEDILQAVKPLLDGLALTVNDDIKVFGDRIYVQATATITNGEHSISTTAFAREALTKKGMDESQITGTASSYARKYALNGLLLIDDNKDADTQDNRQPHHQEPASKPFDIDGAVKAIRGAGDAGTVNKYVQAARTKGASNLQMYSIQSEAIQRIEKLGETA